MDPMALQFAFPTWQQLIMYVVGLTLIVLAVKKEYEPMLLLPIGFGAILVNLPLSVVLTAGRSLDPFVTRFVAANPDAREFFERTLHYVFESGRAYSTEPGVLSILFNAGIITELFPVLIFIAIGAMCDFTPLFKMPQMIFFGAAAQFGIFATLIIAILLGFAHEPRDRHQHHRGRRRPDVDLRGHEAGPKPPGADLGRRLLLHGARPSHPAAHRAAAHVARGAKDQDELPRGRRVAGRPRRLSRSSSRSSPRSSRRSAFPLVGFLMLGNLIRESGVLDRLSKAAQNELANLVTLLLGVTIGSSMTSDKFIRLETLMILSLGLGAFIFDTAGGVMIAKLYNVFARTKVNPMIGAAGISAFPMSARVVHKMAQAEDNQTWILMQAVSANVSGQLGSVVAGGVLLALAPIVLG